jgi:hypothetical protein
LLDGRESTVPSELAEADDGHPKRTVLGDGIGFPVACIERIERRFQSHTIVDVTTSNTVSD